jgi:hypothetical protein
MRVMDQKKVIISDLDGTIALDHHRNHFLHPPHKDSCAGVNSMGEFPCDCGWKRDWKSYFDACGGDEPNWPVIRTLELYHKEGYHIVILSGRSARVQPETEQWLFRNKVPYHYMRLRPEGVHTNDNLLKVQWARELALYPEQVLFIMEDRARVVEAWRDHGYTCFQVAPGTF